MNKTLAVAMVSVSTALLTISTSAFAAPPSGAGQRSPSHQAAVASSQRIHVGPSQPMHTSTGNRVRMTSTHGQTGPAGGRMSSMPNVHRHGGSGTASVRMVPPPNGPRYDRNYVRPSLAATMVRYLPRCLPAGATQGITDAPMAIAPYGTDIPWPITAILTGYTTAATMSARE